MDNPFFTVVIPTHNRSNLLKRAIVSVLNQTFGDFEIIVVDDGSGDNTWDLLREFAGSIVGHGGKRVVRQHCEQQMA